MRTIHRRCTMATAAALAAALCAGCLITFNPPPAPDEPGAGEGGAADAANPDVGGEIGATTDSGSADTTTDAPASGDSAVAHDGAPQGGADAGDGGAFDSGTRIEAGPTALWSFSDDFELGDFRRWDDAPAIGGGATLTVVDAGAHAGCCAAHAATIAGSKTWAYLLESWTTAPGPVPPPAAAVTTGTIAVREWVKATQLDDDTREFSFAQGGSAATADATGGMGSSDNGSTWHWGVFLQSPAVPSSMSLGSAASVGGPDGSYHCVEMVMNVVNPGGYLSIFADGAPTPQVAMGVDTQVTGGWDSLTIGMSYSGGTNPTDVTFDDVKLAIYADTAPTIHIGCGP